MTTRFTSKPTTKPIDGYFLSIVRSAISDISGSSHVFIDDRFRALRNAKEQIRSVLDMIGTMTVLDENDFVDMTTIDDLASLMSMSTRLSRGSSQYCYEALDSYSETVVDSGEKLAATIGSLYKIISAVEAEVLRRCDTASVKDETIIFDQISGKVDSVTGSLLYDARAGAIVLPPVNPSHVKVTIDSVQFNKERGLVVPSPISTPTAQSILNGVYFSRTFSTNPLFEIDSDSDCSRGSDGSLTTSLMMEYNSDSGNEEFSVTMTIVPGTPDIGAISINIDPGDSGSVISRPISEVIIKSVVLTYTDETTEDITAEMVSDSLVIKNSRFGSDQMSFSYTPSDIFPAIVMYIQKRNIKFITVTISTSSPQVVEYPELVFTSDSGSEYSRLSYPETLVAIGYSCPDDRPNPATWYSRDEIGSITRLMETYKHNRIEMEKKFRYLIGIADISGYLLSFSTSGYLETDDLFTRYSSTRKIVSIELYASEKIYSGTSIRYLVGFGNNEWHEITPINRTDIIGATRIVVRPIETTGSDVVVSDRFDLVTDRVYLKIIMTGNGSTTPLLKSYAIRIKTEVVD